MNISVTKTSAETRFFVKFKSPFGFLLIFAATFIFLSFFVQVSAYTYDQYYPYEGKVIDIQKKWFDSFIFDSSDYEHLVIETEDGSIIDRYIDTHYKVMIRVEPGDHVVKKKGFRSKVKVIGKKTVNEMLEEAEKLLKK
ncbi:MAG: hypothetical protein JXR69_11480 [Candidatus Delongbacteria bacterium]|nr:hypothetical protein [Candidatus Delongbacteria bacterium]